MSEFFKLSHLYRGSWFARATSTTSIARLGTAPVPILPDREAGSFDWQAQPGPLYTARLEEGGADWWMSDEHEGWRNALVPGRVVWVRQVMQDGRDDPMVCDSKGLWIIGTAEIGPGRMVVQLSERIGDVT
jgi:hypothetical protein